MKIRLHPVFTLSLLLALSIVFWGMRDKVSLYRTSSKGLPVAKAKLLSGRELAADAANQAEAALPPTLPPAPSQLRLLPVSLLCTRAPMLSRVARRAAPPPLQSPPFARALFRRPPPALSAA